MCGRARLLQKRRVSTPARRYARIMTPEELANLAHLRRARDLIDREYARPLEVAALARAALMSTAHFSRQFRAEYGRNAPGAGSLALRA